MRHNLNLVFDNIQNDDTPRQHGKDEIGSRSQKGILILLDFSKAFDSVDHAKLCGKLKIQFRFGVPQGSILSTKPIKKPSTLAILTIWLLTTYTRAPSDGFLLDEGLSLTLHYEDHVL